MSRKKSIEELEAAGSSRASSRRAERKEAALRRRRAALAGRERPPESAIIDPDSHADILKRQVGYDPRLGSHGCRFDAGKAKAAVRFIHRHAVHAKGDKAGDSFLMEPWQQAIVMALWGWLKPDGTRRYREALVYIPRGNGKTFLAAALAILAYFEDDEPGAEVFCAAAERGQARILWDQARQMILLDPELSQLCDVGANSIQKVEDPLSSFQPISSEAKTKHGGMPHFAVIDELHVQPNDELYEAIRTGMRKKSRRQPMLAMLTTANWYDPEHICNKIHAHACKVRDGTVEDASFLPVIYEARADEDWRDEAVWRRVNPNYGVSVSSLADECERARIQPASLNSFLRLHLNVQTAQETQWISVEQWDACAAVPMPQPGEDCFAGLDLGSTDDLTALVLHFDSGDVLPFVWCPEETARARHRRGMKPDYIDWARRGLIELTPGEACDYQYVRRRVNELASVYNIRDIAFDRWNAAKIVQDLMADGLNVVMWGQGFIDMNPGCKQLERMLLARGLRHGGHPVLRWMAGNVMVETDAAGNIKPSKRKSGGKIDGIVALVMALGLAARAESNTQPAIYAL